MGRTAGQRRCHGALVSGPDAPAEHLPEATYGQVDGQPPRLAPSPALQSWLENPRLSLDFLTPGQRYTAVLTIGLGILLLAFGLPSGL